MLSQLTFIASSPGKRASEVGTIALRVIEVVAILALIAAIFGFARLIFVLLWKHVPFLVILWGISGIPILIIAYIYDSRTLYWVGGIDLGVFLAMWFIAALGGEIED
ncbi:MAG: hypothetical protein ACM3ML_09810 [Micromonosporaceae bacterium]